MNLPAVQVVGHVDGWGALVRVVGGPWRGYEAVVVAAGWSLPPPADPRPGQSPRSLPGQERDLAAHRRANELLESLLDEHQLASWRATNQFWVSGPFGHVRLGRLYDLTHRRSGHPDRSLCVVPRGHSRLPEPDVWTNLLLILRGAPQKFFQVAKVNRRD